MGIRKCGDCFEVVALDEYMVRSIGAGICQCAVFDFDKYGQFVAQPFLYIFGLILPHKAVGLAFAEKSEKR